MTTPLDTVSGTLFRTLFLKHSPSYFFRNEPLCNLLFRPFKKNKKLNGLKRGFQGRVVAQLVECQVKHAAGAGSAAQCGEGFLSQRQLSVQTLLRWLQSPCVQSHAVTSLHMLNIPSIGSHTIAVSYTHLTLPTS